MNFFPEFAGLVLTPEISGGMCALLLFIPDKEKFSSFVWIQFWFIH